MWSRWGNKSSSLLRRLGRRVRPLVPGAPVLFLRRRFPSIPRRRAPRPGATKWRRRIWTLPNQVAPLARRAMGSPPSSVAAPSALTASPELAAPPIRHRSSDAWRSRGTRNLSEGPRVPGDLSRPPLERISRRRRGANPRSDPKVGEEMFQMRITSPLQWRCGRRGIRPRRNIFPMPHCSSGALMAVR